MIEFNLDSRIGRSDFSEYMTASYLDSIVLGKYIELCVLQLKQYVRQFTYTAIKLNLDSVNSRNSQANKQKI